MTAPVVVNVPAERLACARLASEVNLGPADRVPAGRGRTYWVNGRQIAVHRDRRRQLFASQAWCPHHFGTLADGTVGYAEVSCPLHAMRFNLRTGAPRGHSCGTLEIYPVRVSRDGDLLVRVPA